MPERRVLHITPSILPRTETFILPRLQGRNFAPSILGFDRAEDGLDVGVPQSVLFEPARKRDLLRQFHDVKPDVVHAHFGHMGARVFWATTALHIPLVTSFYGFDIVRMGQNLREKIFLKMGSLFTVEGPHMRETLINIGAPASKVHLLPLALPAWAEAEPVRKVSGEEPVLQIIQIARMTPKKGFDVSLRALAAAKERGVKFCFRIAGTGQLEDELRALVKKLDLSEDVAFLGYVPYAQMPALLASAHLLLQPSRIAPSGDTEGGAPATLIEAQAQEVPVLATRHADIPNVVRSGGVLVEEEDARALSEELEKLYLDRVALKRLGTSARRDVLSRHSAAILMEQQERLYLL